MNHQVFMASRVKYQWKRRTTTLACVQPPLPSKKIDFFEGRGGSTQAIFTLEIIGQPWKAWHILWTNH